MSSITVYLSKREEEFLNQLPYERKAHFLILKHELENPKEQSNDFRIQIINLCKDFVCEHYKGRFDEIYSEHYFDPEERNTPEYRNWRQLVLQRDNYICVQCGSTKKLQVHHIKAWRNHKELRHDVSNGQTLCHKCHVKTNNYGTKAKRHCKEQ